MLLVEVPAAGPGHDHRHAVGVLERVVLALGRGQLDGASDGVEEGDLPADDVVPVRGVGVLEVGQPHLRSRVQRVDRHLALGGSGDLHPAVAQVRRRLGHAPLALPKLTRLAEEVEPTRPRHLLAPPLTGGQQLVSPRPEPALQLGQERQCLPGQHLGATLHVDRSMQRQGGTWHVIPFRLCPGGLSVVHLRCSATSPASGRRQLAATASRARSTRWPIVPDRGTRGPCLASSPVSLPIRCAPPDRACSLLSAR